jgi:hypothetical protein
MTGFRIQFNSSIITCIFFCIDAVAATNFSVFLGITPPSTTQLHFPAPSSCRPPNPSPSAAGLQSHVPPRPPPDAATRKPAHAFRPSPSSTRRHARVPATTALPAASDSAKTKRRRPDPARARFRQKKIFVQVDRVRRIVLIS